MFLKFLLNFLEASDPYEFIEESTEIVETGYGTANEIADAIANSAGVTCGGADVLRVIKFVWQLLDIVFIAVPIGLILIIMVDFAKNVMAGREDDMKKNLNLVIKRLIFCVALFLVDPIVHFAIDLLGDQEVNSAKCIEIATTTDDLSKYEIDYGDEDFSFVSTPNYSKDSGLTVGSGGTTDLTEEDLKHLNTYNQVGENGSKRVCSKYPNARVNASACGLSTYMATRYALTKQDTDFFTFTEEACQTGFFNGKGSSWGITEASGNIYEDKYGIKGSEISNDYDTIVSELKKGHVIVALIQAGKSTTSEGGFNFTANGHFIALISYRSSDDTIYVYNPTGLNTGWTSKDKIQKYVINVAILIRSMQAK